MHKMSRGGRMQSRAAQVWLGVALPCVLIALILLADLSEGPKTAFVGVLAVVPMLAAVFGTPLMVLGVAGITWLSAFAFGTVASDGNAAAQTVRLVIIALAGLAAVGASSLRQRRERRLVDALNEAATAAAMRRQAETDQLTGLLNRHGVTRALDGLAPDASRTVAVIDCDGLKQVNDTFGHAAGDEYLVAIAGRLAGGLSKSDLIARWGGDEFIVVQPLTVDAALPVLTRMQTAIHSSPIHVNDQALSSSVSVGVAHWTSDMTFDEALRRSDAALYEAKASGRNQIVTAGD